jgi:hypothetical protein
MRSLVFFLPMGLLFIYNLLLLQFVSNLTFSLFCVNAVVQLEGSVLLVTKSLGSRQVVTNFPPQQPGFYPRMGHVDSLWTKYHGDKFFLYTLVSPTNSILPTTDSIVK